MLCPAEICFRTHKTLTPPRPALLPPPRSSVRNTHNLARLDSTDGGERYGMRLEAASRGRRAMTSRLCHKTATVITAETWSSSSRSQSATNAVHAHVRTSDHVTNSLFMGQDNATLTLYLRVCLSVCLSVCVSLTEQDNS